MKVYRFLFLLSLPLACSASHYVEGLLAKDRGDYETAYREFEKVSPSHSVYPRARTQMGEIRGKAKAVEKTRKAAEAALSRNDQVGARVALRRLLVLKPGDPWGQDRLTDLNAAPPPKERRLREVETLISQRRFYEAKSILENYMKGHPNDARARSLSRKADGEITRRETEVEVLIQAAEKAEEDGNIVSSYIYYGKAAILLPEDERAAEALKDMEGSIGQALDATLTKAQELISQGKGDEAVTLLELNLEARKTHEGSKKLIVQALNALALDNYRSSNYDMAVEYWKKLLGYDPGNTKAREYMKRAKKLAKRVKEL